MFQLYLCNETKGPGTSFIGMFWSCAITMMQSKSVLPPSRILPSLYSLFHVLLKNFSFNGIMDFLHWWVALIILKLTIPAIL